MSRTRSTLTSVTSRLERENTVELCSGLFHLHYGSRVPASGSGLGRHGVVPIARQALIDGYCEGIRRCEQWFREAGWPTPPLGEKGHVPVYVLDPLEVSGLGRDSACTIARQSAGFPDATTIILRSSLSSTDHNRWREQAEVEAAHETAHVYLHGWLSPLAKHANDWEWFDEASATFIEGLVCPANSESLRFARQAVSQPELPISVWKCSEPDEGYSAAWFVRHLVQKLGASRLLEIWKLAATTARPWDAVASVLESHSASLSEAIWDYGREWNNSLDVRATQLWGHRPFTWVLTPSEKSADPAAVFPEGCRYYRIDIPTDMNVQVQVKTGASAAAPALRAELISTAAPHAAGVRLIDDGNGVLSAQLRGGTYDVLIVGIPQPALPKSLRQLSSAAIYVEVSIT